MDSLTIERKIKSRPISAAQIERAKRWRVECKTWKNEPYFKTDARLIATAEAEAFVPEMLAMLKEIVNKMNCVCRLNLLLDAQVPCKTCRINNLIAEVEGRTSVDARAT